MYSLVPNDDRTSFDVVALCADVRQDKFEQLSACEKRCGTCVLDDDLCWICDQSAEPTEKPGLFKRFFSWLGNGFERLINLFSGKKTAAPSEPVLLELNTAKQTARTAAMSVLAYDNGSAMDQEDRIEQELREAIAAAEDIGGLLKLHSLFLMYCQKKHSGNHDASAACQAEFMQELKKRGDILKEQLFAEIDPTDTSPAMHKKMETLRSILLAGTSASGEGVWFSTDNINRIMAGLKEKFQQWFRNGLLNAKLEDLNDWRILALVYTSAGTNADGSSGSGLYEGGNPISDVQYRARRLALQRLMEIDVCQPDPAKLKAFQDFLATTGCEKLLGNARACTLIAGGNLEAAYAALYDQDENDIANGLTQNRVAKPIDCRRPQVTNDTEITHETAQPENPADNSTTADSTENATNQDIEPITDDESDENVDSPDGNEPISSNQTLPADSANEPTGENPTIDPPTTCQVIIFSDPVVGWDFYLRTCDRTYAETLRHFADCGAHPPLVRAEELEPDIMCYETVTGRINYELITPCVLLPPPDQSVVECVRTKLLE
ncbi:MAG: hypothetical protein V1738_02170 [Patescibacteria group bacterium]